MLHRGNQLILIMPYMAFIPMFSSMAICDMNLRGIILSTPELKARKARMRNLPTVIPWGILLKIAPRPI